MAVEILETIIVQPNPPPPAAAVLSLSHLDTDRNLDVTVRTLRLYALPISSSSADDDPSLLIAGALSSALYHFYPLAGSLRRRHSDSRLQLHYSPADESHGVPLTRASSPITLSDLDPRSTLASGFTPDPTPAESFSRPLALQVTRLACGGFALGMCVHHALCDGAGAAVFLNALASIARGLGSALHVEPVWDREIFLGPRKPPRVEPNSFYDFLYMDATVASGGPYEAAVVGSVAREFFHVSEASLDKLRTELCSETGQSFTSFEVLCAYIWRARIKAMDVGGDEKVKMVYSMSIRKLVRPALPAFYWGNGCVPVYVQLTAGELLKQPISKTASLIRSSKISVTDEYVKSYIDFQELYYDEGITAGKWVSAFTDWRHLNHSEADFGWGAPVGVLPLSWKLLGSVEPCFFLPRSPTDENKDCLRVLVCLRKSALPAFRSEMEMLNHKMISTMSF